MCEQGTREQLEKFSRDNQEISNSIYLLATGPGEGYQLGTPKRSPKDLKGPSQPHLCFCFRARIWLI